MSSVWPQPAAVNLTLRASIIGPLLLLSDGGARAFGALMDQASTTTSDEDRAELDKALDECVTKFPFLQILFNQLRAKRIVV